MNLQLAFAATLVALTISPAPTVHAQLNMNAPAKKAYVVYAAEPQSIAANKQATLELRRNYSARKKDEKDTKTHQIRRIALDATTAGILVAQYSRYADRVVRIGDKPREDAYIFSYAPDNSRPCSPDGLTHRYSRMTAFLGLDTHIHELRHYSATELLAAGVDLRTVGGRLGHAGGGVTTLRVYAAWVGSVDEQAAAVLADRLTGGLPRSRRAEDVA